MEGWIVVSVIWMSYAVGAIGIALLSRFREEE
jgi:uncharacterized membrane protein YoaK (UPF0700 family)